MAADLGNLVCPVPATADTVQLAHGGGGRAMERLLDTIFRPAFANEILDRRHDGARLDLAGPLAFTTDSYVVKPLVFPGGDIGTLAVNGTVNDLAMCGARPVCLSAGFILEEGLPLDTLRGIVASMRDAAAEAGVAIVTGDIKVVDRGKADGLYINTAGIGRIVSPDPVEPQAVRPGDVVILSGDIGRHGIAVMAVRENFAFEFGDRERLRAAFRTRPRADRRGDRRPLPSRPHPRRTGERTGRGRHRRRTLNRYRGGRGSGPRGRRLRLRTARPRSVLCRQ